MKEWAGNWVAGTDMSHSAQFKEPRACTEDERRAFAHLVRLGFEGSDEGLEGRIRDANVLAYHYVADATLGAIAALKVPTSQHRDAVFAEAGVSARPADYLLELGWVFVAPKHRGNHIAVNLCRLLLARVPASDVFATTTPGNMPMIRILHSLGFVHAEKPVAHPRRKEELALFLRARWTLDAAQTDT